MSPLLNTFHSFPSIAMVSSYYPIWVLPGFGFRQQIKSLKGGENNHACAEAGSSRSLGALAFVRYDFYFFFAFAFSKFSATLYFTIFLIRASGIGLSRGN